MALPKYRQWYVNYAIEGDKTYFDEPTLLPDVMDETETPDKEGDNVTGRPRVDFFSETVEGSMLQTLFRQPVKLFVGARQKVIRYVHLSVGPPSQAAQADLRPTFYRIHGVSIQKDIESGWSDRSSPGFKIMPDRTVAVRDNKAGQTDLLIAALGVKSGVHFWSVRWDQEFGGIHPVIGVGRRDATTQSDGYEPLVGLDEKSYGWHLRQRCLVHDLKTTGGERVSAYPADQFERLVSDNRDLNYVLMVLDMDEGTLGFMVYGIYLGHAFTGLKGRLYPMASTTFNNAMIRINYEGSYSKTIGAPRKRARPNP